MKLNPDKEIVNKITAALKENDGYCPCTFVKNEDTKCKCKDCREKNVCICGLFVQDDVIIDFNADIEKDVFDSSTKTIKDPNGHSKVSYITYLAKLCLFKTIVACNDILSSDLFIKEHKIEYVDETRATKFWLKFNDNEEIRFIINPTVI